jgi:large subunit ribosomal protein L13
VETSAKITKSMRKEDVTRKWLVVDATNQTLGRLATQVAMMLRGKNKPCFTSHVDTGDYVVVINAEKIQLEPKRAEKKEYYHYTGFPGGGRMESFKSLISRRPTAVIEHAVKGMLPKNRLGRVIIKKLKVYAGPEHPHAAQMPETVELTYH